jgi:hypothetical protein
MEVQSPSYGDDGYLGSTGTAGSFHRAQPLVLVALLATLFALALWQGNPKPTISTPPIQTVDLVGGKY